MQKLWGEESTSQAAKQRHPSHANLTTVPLRTTGCLLNGAFAAQALRRRSEAALLWALLEAYPTPCPYAALHAALVGMPERDAGSFIEGYARAKCWISPCIRCVSSWDSARSSSKCSTWRSARWTASPAVCSACGTGGVPETAERKVASRRRTERTGRYPARQQRTGQSNEQERYEF